MATSTQVPNLLLNVRKLHSEAKGTLRLKTKKRDQKLTTQSVYVLIKKPYEHRVQIYWSVLRNHIVKQEGDDSIIPL